ncbi:unnamed protein product, partial [Heterosigma akashiwo]
ATPRRHGGGGSSRPQLPHPGGWHPVLGGRGPGHDPAAAGLRPAAATRRRRRWCRHRRWGAVGGAIPPFRGTQQPKEEGLYGSMIVMMRRRGWAELDDHNDCYDLLLQLVA